MQQAYELRLSKKGASTPNTSKDISSVQSMHSILLEQV
jgi:hypothetical protein